MHCKSWEQCIIYASKHLRERTGAYCRKASVKSLNMSQLGLPRTDLMEAAHGKEGGLNRMLDRRAMTSVNQTSQRLPLSLTTAVHSSYSPLNNQLGLGSCFKEIVHSSKALVMLAFKRFLWNLPSTSKDRQRDVGLIINHCDSITFVFFK